MYVVYQYLVFERAIDARHGYGPRLVTYAVHWHAGLPGKPRSVAANVQEVAESDIDQGFDNSF